MDKVYLVRYHSWMYGTDEIKAAYSTLKAAKAKAEALNAELDKMLSCASAYVTEVTVEE